MKLASPDSRKTKKRQRNGAYPQVTFGLAGGGGKTHRPKVIKQFGLFSYLAYLALWFAARSLSLSLSFIECIESFFILTIILQGSSYFCPHVTNEKIKFLGRSDSAPRSRRWSVVELVLESRSHGAPSQVTMPPSVFRLWSCFCCSLASSQLIILSLMNLSVYLPILTFFPLVLGEKKVHILLSKVTHHSTLLQPSEDYIPSSFPGPSVPHPWLFLYPQPINVSKTLIC